MFDETNSEFHRADLKLDNELIIEIQNSPIVIKEVSQRENFNIKNGLIWILNAKNLIPKSSFVNFFKPDNCLIKIYFLTEHYSVLETKDIVKDLLERDYHSLRFLQKNVTDELIEYQFSDNTIVDTNFRKDLLECSIDSLIWRHSRINHNNKSSFIVEIKEFFDKSRHYYIFNFLLELTVLK